MPSWMHIHRYRVVEVQYRYVSESFYVLWTKKTCRCGAAKIRAKEAFR